MEVPIYLDLAATDIDCLRSEIDRVGSFQHTRAHKPPLTGVVDPVYDILRAHYFLPALKTLVSSYYRLQYPVDQPILRT